MRCRECLTTRHKKLHEDPRDPILDDGPILCADCFRQAVETLIDELEDQIRQYEQELSKL